MQRLLRQILHGVIVLWGALTLVFLLFSLVPDPARQIAGQNEREEIVEAFRERHGLNQPISIRYIRFLAELSPVGTEGLKMPGLGRSYLSERPVAQAISEAFFPTFLLATGAMGMALILGVSLGVVLGMSGDTRWGKAVLGLATLGMSAPSFVMAICIAWLMGHVLHEYTGLPMTGGWKEVDPFFGPRIAARHAILPMLTLGIRPLSVVVQLTRNAVLEVMSSSYIRTARSKGLGLGRIALKHVLRNALNPVLTSASGWFATLLAGAVFVEFVFGWQGMGLLMFKALESGDLPMVMGCVVVIATLFVAINALMEWTYGLLDPRV
jgi:peptide/nickel transport system permease protein